MSSTLDIRLLGDFRLVYGDNLVTSVNTARLHSLLAYLVLHCDALQSRQHLAFLFWPDTTEAQARNNLRQLLHQLRHALPDADSFVDVASHTLRWNPDAPFRLDVREFEHEIARASAAERRGDHRSQQAALEHADSLYGADLLPSCYDEWIVTERERLRQQHLQALAQLVELLQIQGDDSEAIRYAQRWIRCDPLAEDAYRRLMLLLSQHDDRAGALRLYHTCVTVLQRELGTEPSSATREIYARLLHEETSPLPATAPPVLVTPAPSLIGRQPEWEQLEVSWRRLANGRPGFVLVSGEAGIGKSRLTEELLAWVGQQGFVAAKTRSYAAEGQLALAPVAEWLRSDGLRPYLARLDPVWLTEVARILPELLAERPDLPHFEPMTEYGQRQRLFEALARAVLVAPQPLLLVIDNLQWCDQETLEWLHFLLRFDPTARLLIAGTSRTEETLPDHPLRTLVRHLRNETDVMELALQPLDAAETARLAAQVTKRALDTQAAMSLYRQTEGNPLFVVETMRAGLEQAPRNAYLQPVDSGDVPVLPPKVYAVIAERLAQLSTSARDLTELAAVIGRSFTSELLVAAVNASEDSVVSDLDELWHKRIVREHGRNGYDFTHDKLREVAYMEISIPQRRRLHQHTAKALERLNMNDLAPVSSQIASHYERAGMIEQALPYYQRAGAVAQSVYANEDAIGLLSHGLKLVKQLPPGPQRDTHELGMLLALAPIYRVTKGWTAPELEGVLNRALVLCDKVGHDDQRIQVLLGLQSHYVVEAKLEKVHTVSEELFRLYQHAQAATPPHFAGLMRAGAKLHLGQLDEANVEFERIIAVRDPQQIQHLQASQGVSYTAHARAWHSHVLWLLGYPAQALSRGQEAVQLARNLTLPFNQALTMAYLALLQQLCSDDAVARTGADAALALASEYKAPYYQAWSAILGCYAVAWQQPSAEHTAQLREAVSMFLASGARIRLPYYLSLLARVHAKAGQVDEGLEVVDEAMESARVNGERWWDAELHRLRGNLLLVQGADARDVEAALLRAISIARSQHARSLELRAATSLAQLWHTHHRSNEACQLLSECYNWFTEGFDTPDLQAARALLAQITVR